MDPLFGLSESGFERLPTVKCKSIVHGPYLDQNSFRVLEQSHRNSAKNFTGRCR